MRLLALALLITVAPAPSAAQRLQQGSVVRVWSRDSTFIKRQLRVGALVGDTVLLLDGRQPFQRTLSSFERMEIRVRRTPRRGGRQFAKVGSWVGLGLGAAWVIAFMANDNCSNPEGQCASDYAPSILVVTTALGAMVGYPVGLVVRGREWRSVQLDTLR